MSDDVSYRWSSALPCCWSPALGFCWVSCFTLLLASCYTMLLVTCSIPAARQLLYPAAGHLLYPAAGHVLYPTDGLLLYCFWSSALFWWRWFTLAAEQQLRSSILLYRSAVALYLAVFSCTTVCAFSERSIRVT
jgi:hypothetical protein